MTKKTFKTTKNVSFGASKAEKVVPGDLVMWKSWEYSVDSEVFEEKIGLLVEIIEENRLENPVLIGKIMVFGSDKYEFIPLISLQKSKKKD